MQTQRLIELRFSATGLANKDVLSLSDPFLVVHTYVDGAPRRLVARTEVIIDDLDPVWVGKLIVPATLLGCGAMFVVHAFDEDAPDVGMEALDRHDFLGRALFGLDDVMMRSGTDSNTQRIEQRKSARNISNNRTVMEFGGSRLESEGDGTTLTVPFLESEALLYCQKIVDDVMRGKATLRSFMDGVEEEGKNLRRKSKEGTTITMSDIGGQECENVPNRPQGNHTNTAKEMEFNGTVEDNQTGRRDSRAFDIDKTEPDNDTHSNVNRSRVSFQREPDAVNKSKGHAYQDSVDSAVTDVDYNITRDVLNKNTVTHDETIEEERTRTSTMTTTTKTTRTREKVSTANRNSISSTYNTTAIPTKSASLASPQSTNTAIPESSKGLFNKHPTSLQQTPQQQQREKVPSSKFLPLSTSETAFPVALVTNNRGSNDEFTFSAADASSLRRATTSRRAVNGLRGSLTVRGEFLSAKRGRTILLDVHSTVVKARTTSSSSSSSSLSIPSSSKSFSGCGVGMVGSAAAAAAMNKVAVLRQFYEVRRRSPSGGSSDDKSNWDVVYRSEDGGVIVNGSHIKFNRVVLSEQELHNGSPDRRIRIVALRRRLKHKHDVIAWVDTTWNELVDEDNRQYCSHQRQRNRSRNSDGASETDEPGSNSETQTHHNQQQQRHATKSSNVSDPAEHVLRSSSTVTTTNDMYSTNQNSKLTESQQSDTTPKRENSKTIPLQTEFHDLDDSGVGNATVRTYIVSASVAENETEVVRMVVELNHFVGPKYKAVLPKTAEIFSSVGAGGRMGSPIGKGGLLKGVSGVKSYADEDEDDCDKMRMKLSRRKTISSIPTFITRH